jgi:hypothetical protein
VTKLFTGSHSSTLPSLTDCFALQLLKGSLSCRTLLQRQTAHDPEPLQATTMLHVTPLHQTFQLRGMNSLCNSLLETEFPAMVEGES